MAYVRSGSGADIRSLTSGDSTQSSMGAMGDQIIVPQWNQWAQEGLMFFWHHPTKQTAVALGGTSFSDTAPAFLIDVPTGTDLIPYRFRLRQGGTVAGGVITVIIGIDTVQRYSSGGTDRSGQVRNFKTGGAASQRATKMTQVRTGATATAVTTDINVYANIITHDVATTPNSMQNRVEWPEMPGGPVPIVRGPGSLLIYTFAATTQPSWFWGFEWAEIPSANIN